MRTRIGLLMATLAAGLSLHAAAPGAASTEPQGFRVGAAVVDVSPSKVVDLGSAKVCLGGYGIGCTRPATGEREPLYARAIVVESGGEKVALVTSSNVGLFAKYKDAFGDVGAYDVRIAAAEATGIPSAGIIVTSDHSHSSPDVEGIWGGSDTAYLQALADGLVQSVVDADAALEEAELYVGSGTYLRPEPDHLDNHWDGTGGVLDQIDRELRVLEARRPDGGVIATLINFAPHASVLNERSLASGDWTGVVANRAMEHRGGVAMAMVGALGGVGARYSASQFDDFVAFVEGLVDEALDGAQRIEAPVVASANTFIREPLTAPLLYAGFVPISSQHEANAVEASIDRAVTPPWGTANLIGTHVSAVRIGNVVIGGAPGEAYPEISFALSRSVVASEHMILGLANDQLGYLISPMEGVTTTAENGALYPLQGNDNFALSVSPTIGDHVGCTLLDLSRELGFDVAAQTERCATLTATDGVGAPPEVG